MICKNCNNELSTNNCSEREGLVFYCICDNEDCEAVNKVEIDLNINSMVSTLAEDSEYEKVKELFARKNAKIEENRKKEMEKKTVEILSLMPSGFRTSSGINSRYMVDDMVDMMSSILGR